MSARRVTITGATGLIGARLVQALADRGSEVTVLTRDPGRARATLGEVTAISWDPLAGPAPAAALAGRDAVVNLAGEPIDQRWTARARQAIRESRLEGTRNLVAGLAELGGDRPGTLLSASAVGYYGAHAEEPLDEEAAPGSGFLARLCVNWEAEAQRAGALGVRVVTLRTGVVLARSDGALARMLPIFRLGIGGPVAGGRQYVSWIHLDDHVALILAALDDERYSGPFNSTAPEPVTNRELSRVLGRVLRRPAMLPVPAIALRALYGEMAEVVTSGVRAMPARALVLGFEFGQPHIEAALRAALGR